MKRREFLSTAVFAFGAIIGSTGAAAAVDDATREAGDAAVILADRLLRVHPTPRSLAVIGEAYRQDADENDARCRGCLSEAISGFLRHLDISEADLRQMTPTAIRRCIKSGTARDFSRGRVGVVRGWLLGETEVRLCAIAALRTA